MNYLADPCNDRAISSVPTPVHMKEPLPDALLYPSGIHHPSIIFENNSNNRKGCVGCVGTQLEGVEGVLDEGREGLKGTDIEDD